MPQMRAAAPRACPSSTKAIASIRRAAAPSDVAAASRRKSLALCSVRVIATPLAGIPVLRKGTETRESQPVEPLLITGPSSSQLTGPLV